MTPRSRFEAYGHWCDLSDVEEQRQELIWKRIAGGLAMAVAALLIAHAVVS